MKNHYLLLGLEPTAPAEEIRRAFRREIARYHPDKVQHLGVEFQEIAATRAAELTEAYRILMDAEARQKYDDALGSDAALDTPSARAAPVTDAQPPAGVAPDTHGETAPPEPADRRFQRERATMSEFVKKAALAKLNEVLGEVRGSAAAITVAGFDAAYIIKPPRSLFRKAEPAVQLLARVVALVNGEAVAEGWRLSRRIAAFDGVTCLMLLGGEVSSTGELGAAVAEQRRRTRTSPPVVIPVNIRTWDALFPPEAPGVVRELVGSLQT